MASQKKTGACNLHGLSRLTKDDEKLHLIMTTYNSSGLSMALDSVTVKSVDMRDDMRQEAISCAVQALEAHDVEKDIAAFIKKYFDGRYEPTWHCIVGQSFGSFVTHESGHFIYLYIGQQAILLFKAG